MKNQKITTIVLPEPKLKSIKSKNGISREYYSIRLKFPIDPIYGTKRPDRDVYDVDKKKCIAKAKKLWSEYVPLVPGSNRAMSIVTFIKQVFLPFEEARANLAKSKKGISWAHFEDRKQRLNKYLIDPGSTLIIDCPIRKKEIGRIAPCDVRNYFEVLERAGVSPYIIRFLKVDLRQAFGKCIDDLSFPRAQLFDGVTMPPLPTKPVQLHDVDRFLEILWDESKPLMSRCLIFFALTTMSRNSEQHALLWSDIDWDKKTVRIDKAMRRSKNGCAVSPGTKRGDSSNRTLVLDDDLINFLKRLHDEMDPPRPYVFATSTGAQLSRNNFRSVWARMKRELGLPKDCPSFYKWKHTGNSWLQALGVSKAAIKQRMAHSPKSILAETVYQGVTPKEEDQLMEAFRSKLSRTKQQAASQSQGKSVVNFRVTSVNRKFMRENT